MAERICKDCLAEDPSLFASGRPLRPAPYPGPRCATHHRAKRKENSRRAHGRRVEQVYGISEERYWELYELQSGLCAICRRAKGTGKRRLAVDHDHSCCSGKTSCGNCVRGLVCSTCNDELAHARDQIAHFGRAITYLKLPPAQAPTQWAVAMTYLEPL